jgi:hypothetical protein
MSTLLHNKSATGIRLKKFGLALKASPPLLRRNQQLIFLCGANQAENVPSARRTALKNFIHKNSASSTVIYAEGVFGELRKYGSQKNALDLEHRIAKIADKVIIVLESPSAYCEFGAFAHHTLREKLIVVNDSRYKESESFINLGPIAAVQEVKSPVIWYPMSKTGVTALDGIGAAFPEILRAVEHTSKVGVPIEYSLLSSLEMDKSCLYFIHDLVLLAGPITHAEIAELLKFIFDEKDFDTLKSLLGVLRESKLVSTRQLANKSWIYSATTTDFFLRYQCDLNALMASFRAHHLKANAERFKHG